MITDNKGNKVKKISKFFINDRGENITEEVVSDMNGNILEKLEKK